MKPTYKHVCVQGLGYVGSAMAVAIANARKFNGDQLYQVTGVDQPTTLGCERVAALNAGVFPFKVSDSKLLSALELANQGGNLKATTDESIYQSADIIVMDVGLDVPFLDSEPIVDTRFFEKAIRSIGKYVKEGALLIVETTVPPGTSENLVLPLLESELQKRGIDKSSVHLAHSFERVMPGRDYLASITNYWRVYAGATDDAADVCDEFLSTIVNVKDYPLTRLSTMTASETTKVMENSYRATNIAFIDEWTKYAEAIGIDLYEVIDAIRVRPTHSNIRFPGLGVGGYCLTKDPAFAPASVRTLCTQEKLEFPFSNLARKTNQEMPLHTLSRLETLLETSVAGKSILVLGVSYKQDVGDTRYSPVEILVSALEERDANVTCYDPFIEVWAEKNRKLPREIPSAESFEVVVIATSHSEFQDLDLLNWLRGARPIILDTVNVVNKSQREKCRAEGVRVESVGRGDGL